MSDDAVLDYEDSVVLACLAIGEPNIEVSWSYKGRTLETTPLISITEQQVVYDNRTYTLSSLELCSVDRSHAGIYSCSVTNGQTLDTASTLLTVAGVSGE